MYDALEANFLKEHKEHRDDHEEMPQRIIKTSLIDFCPLMLQRRVRYL